MAKLRLAFLVGYRIAVLAVLLVIAVDLYKIAKHATDTLPPYVRVWGDVSVGDSLQDLSVQVSNLEQIRIPAPPRSVHVENMPRLPMRYEVDVVNTPSVYVGSLPMGTIDVHVDNMPYIPSMLDVNVTNRIPIPVTPR